MGASMLPHRSLRRPAEVGTARLAAASRLEVSQPRASRLSRRSVAALVLALALPNAGHAQRTPDPPMSIDIVAQRLPPFAHPHSTPPHFGLLQFRAPP